MDENELLLWYEHCILVILKQKTFVSYGSVIDEGVRY